MPLVGSPMLASLQRSASQKAVSAHSCGSLRASGLEHMRRQGRGAYLRLGSSVLSSFQCRASQEAASAHRPRSPDSERCRLRQVRESACVSSS